ncbi:MAG: ABC transporter permease subunit [Clostridiales bacterium]|nr:ABC transporter permease subunit [Clostridiales bacterium]
MTQAAALPPQRIRRALGKKRLGGLAVLFAFMLFFYGPLMYMFLLAFADSYNFPAILPNSYGFTWWRYVFDQPNTLVSITNSFLFATFSTALSFLICIPAAYVLARFQFKGRKLIMFLFLLGNAFPKIGMYTSMGIIFYRIGLMGTFPGVLLIHMLGTMMQMIWLPAGAFRSVPRHLEEAARDAGASPLRTFIQVTLPVAWPGIAVALLYAFIGSLGESVGTLFVGLPQWRTMMTEMYGVILDFPATAGAVFALLLIIPNFFLLLLMRKYIGADTMAKGFKMG